MNGKHIRPHKLSHSHYETYRELRLHKHSKRTVTPTHNLFINPHEKEHSIIIIKTEDDHGETNTNGRLHS
jgi:hypothetical protein